MALDRIHLRKLLQLMFLEPNKLRSAIRTDIRDELAKEDGTGGSGGDFYIPFWADAKSHVFAVADLHDLVEQRIAANRRRSNLYPLLRDGFLLWWNERRRWTNEPFQPGPSLKAQVPFPSLRATVKVDSILSVRDGLDAEHAVYPYFVPDPELSENAARLGLWLLIRALPAYSPNEIRILDVIRGRTFSLDRTPLRGDEEEEFRRRYAAILQLRQELQEEYE
ncbi:MAG: hypothetical protein ABS35_41880 [Kaistia sp. SCN 65-12]|nr:MAG: hypothetical protein ABS35_41880 [Kaistia sp. SCN 65-12]